MQQQQEMDLHILVNSKGEDSKNHKFRIFTNTSDIECYFFDQNQENQRFIFSHFLKQKNKQLEMSQKERIRYKITKRGRKNDTVQLNINFKTLLLLFFKELRQANELSQYQLNHIDQFKKRIPSFNSLFIFLDNTEQNQGIRAKSLEFFSSKYCIKNILSGRCKMKNKLQMIKFVERVRLNILTQGEKYKWKDITKKC